MLDQIENQIARNLADRHLYPYAQNIYLDIFKAFSHFPLKLKDVDLDGEGHTITFLALVVKTCFDKKVSSFLHLYQEVLEKLMPLSQKMVQDVVVETYLGCMLYYYHPVHLRSQLGKNSAAGFFSEKERYEYELKRKTILIFAI